MDELADDPFLRLKKHQAKTSSKTSDCKRRPASSSRPMQGLCVRTRGIPPASASECLWSRPRRGPRLGSTLLGGGDSGHDSSFLSLDSRPGAQHGFAAPGASACVCVFTSSLRTRALPRDLGERSPTIAPAARSVWSTLQ